MRRAARCLAFAVVCAGPCVPPNAYAHDGTAPAARIWGAWTWDPLALGALSLSAWIYVHGLRRLWRHAGAGKGIRIGRALMFTGALGVLAIALLSPIDAASDILFSVHMVQHEMLTLIAAPLLVLGRPNVAAAWALPRSMRESVLGLARRHWIVRCWRVTTAPVVALVTHGATLWVWHVPALFEAALADEAIHALQHATFLVTAVLFWWSLLVGRYGRAGYGVATLLVFVTAVHNGTLGALITVASELWYPTHAQRTTAAGIEALQDQQLAGLLMWVPCGVLFASAALALFAAWIGESERRVARWQL